MFNKKNTLFLTLFLITSIQILIYINNNQKISFRYFIWTSQELRIGKLICISFVSGLLVSSILNKSINLYNKKNDINYKKNNEEDYSYEKNINEEENKSKYQMPPERDIRDAQPTISVNYRVIENTGENYSEYDKNSSNNEQFQDDWDNNDKDW